MDNLKKILEVLNDLIRINKDREAGYNKISRELTPAEHNLRSAFERKAQDSRNNISQLQTLSGEIQHQLSEVDPSEQPADNLSGKIYKMWEEVKDFFTGTDKPSVLRSCADGDGKAKGCYESALELNLPAKLEQVLHEQKDSLDASQKEIMELMSK